MPNLLTGQEIMTALQRLQGLADNKICAFAWFVVRRFDEERVPQAAASMTFTTLLALVPVLTVTVAVASIFPMLDRWSDLFVYFVNQTIEPQGADMVFDYINAFREQANRLTAIGSVMLVVTSLMLIRTIDNTFNRIGGSIPASVDDAVSRLLGFTDVRAAVFGRGHFLYGRLGTGCRACLRCAAVVGRVANGGDADLHDAFAVGAVPLRAKPLRSRAAGVCRSFGNSVLSGNRTLPLYLVYAQLRRLQLDLRSV